MMVIDKSGLRVVLLSSFVPTVLSLSAAISSSFLSLRLRLSHPLSFPKP